MFFKRVYGNFFTLKLNIWDFLIYIFNSMYVQYVGPCFFNKLFKTSIDTFSLTLSSYGSLGTIIPPPDHRTKLK